MVGDNKAIVGTIFEVEIYPEGCCDECCEIVHNHFDCPVCKREYANTDIYDSVLYEEFISCEDCGSKFKFVSNNRIFAEIKLLEVGVK